MPTNRPITEYRLSGHARLEMERRQIAEGDVAQVLAAPEQTETVEPGCIVCQSHLPWGEPPRTYLLRVFVDIDREPPTVPTVYRTSKLSKYWRAQP